MSVAWRSGKIRMVHAVMTLEVQFGMHLCGLNSHDSLHLQCVTFYLFAELTSTRGPVVDKCFLFLWQSADPVSVSMNMIYYGLSKSKQAGYLHRSIHTYVSFMSRHSSTCDTCCYSLPLWVRIPSKDSPRGTGVSEIEQ